MSQLTQQQQLAKVQAERQVFIDAYNTGKITYDQFKQAIDFNNQQLVKLQSQSATPQTVQAPSSATDPTSRPGFSYVAPSSEVPAGSLTPDQRTSYIQQQIDRNQAVRASMQAARSLGLPEDLGSQYDLRNVQVPQGSKVTGYELIPFVGPFKNESDRPAPSLSIKYEQTPTSREAEIAAAERDILNLTQRGTERTGTRTTTASGKNPSLSEYNLALSKYSPETRIIVEQRRQERALNVAKNTALGVGSIIAAPIIGPTGTAIAAGAGVGITQGIKTASELIEGKPLTLISPQEAYEAAASGVVLSVVGGGAAKGISKVAGKAATSLGITVTNAERQALAVANRVGVNTLIGGGVNYTVSGGDPKATLEGAAFGAGLGIVGEVIGAGASRLKSPTGEQLTGVREIEKQITKGKVTDVTRLTEPITERVKISRADAKILENVYDVKVDLAGTEKVALKGGKGANLEVSTFERPVESTRSLNPIKAAIDGEPYKIAKAEVNNINKFLETPSDFVAVRETKVTTGTGKSGKPAVFSEQKIIGSKEAILPDTKLITRDFTGVQTRGKIDPKVYADIAKSLPTEISDDIYKQLGGQYRNVFEGPNTARDLTGPMKPLRGSKTKGTSKITDPLNPSSNKAITETVKADIAKAVEVNLPRNIIKVNTPQTIINLPPVNSTTTKQNRKTTHAATVNVNVPALVKSEAITPTQVNKISNIIGNLGIIRTRSSQQNAVSPVEVTETIRQANRIIGITSSRTQKRTNISPIVEPEPIKKDRTITPPIVVRIDPITGQQPRQEPRQEPRQKTPTKLAPMQVQEPKLKMPQFNTTVTTPKIYNPTRSRATYPSIRLGGDAGGSRRKGLTRGAWFEKTNPVKTYRSMLQTFGLGAPKPKQPPRKQVNNKRNQRRR